MLCLRMNFNRGTAGCCHSLRLCQKWTGAEIHIQEIPELVAMLSLPQIGCGDLSDGESGPRAASLTDLLQTSVDVGKCVVARSFSRQI